MILVLAPSPALDVTYLVDEVRIGGIHRPSEVIRSAGGKGVNLARAAVALGGSVRVLATVGGPVGDAVLAQARADGISVGAVEVPTPTRECITVFGREGDPTEFYEPATPLGAEDWEGLSRLARGESPSWAVVAGRLPAGSAARAGELLAGLRSGGARIALDSSGPDLAELLDRLTPDLLKINRSEAAELVSRDPRDDLAALAGEVYGRTGGRVVLTDGAAGALALDDDGVSTWAAAPDPEPGRFAVGSGDSFLAGLLVALERGDGLAGALHLASAAGSANTRRPGAARFDAEDVAAAAGRIRVEARR